MVTQDLYMGPRCSVHYCMMLMQAMALPMQGGLLLQNPPNQYPNQPHQLPNVVPARQLQKINEASCLSLQRSSAKFLANAASCEIGYVDDRCGNLSPAVQCCSLITIYLLARHVHGYQCCFEAAWWLQERNNIVCLCYIASKVSTLFVHQHLMSWLQAAQMHRARCLFAAMTILFNSYMPW